MSKSMSASKRAESSQPTENENTQKKRLLDESDFFRIKKFIEGNPSYFIPYYPKPLRDVNGTHNVLNFVVCIHNTVRKIWFQSNSPFVKSYEGHCEYSDLLGILMADISKWESQDATQESSFFNPDTSDKLKDLHLLKNLNLIAQTAIADRLGVEPEPEFIKTIQERLKDDSVKSVCMKSCKPKSLEDQLKSDKITALENDLQKAFDLQLDLVETVTDGLARLTKLYGSHDKAIAEINQQYDHAFAPRLSDLELENNDLKKAIADLTLKIATLQSDLGKLKDTFIPSVEAIATQSEDVTSSTFVIRLTHCDRHYEAFWRENNSSFSIFEVNRHGELTSVGGVTVEKNQLWTDDIFLSISKSIISSYLDGKESSLSPF